MLQPTAWPAQPPSKLAAMWHPSFELGLKPSTIVTTSVTRAEVRNPEITIYKSTAIIRRPKHFSLSTFLTETIFLAFPEKPVSASFGFFGDCSRKKILERKEPKKMKKHFLKEGGNFLFQMILQSILNTWSRNELLQSTRTQKSKCTRLYQPQHT